MEKLKVELGQAWRNWIADKKIRKKYLKFTQYYKKINKIELMPYSKGGSGIFSGPRKKNDGTMPGWRDTHTQFYQKRYEGKKSKK